MIACTFWGRASTLSRISRLSSEISYSVAGFSEFGETVEETVKREVKEELGIEVKNLKYYKSQPWALSASLLFGFFAEAEDTFPLRPDKNELKEAAWFKRNEMPVEDDGVSLTREMMMAFKRGEV